MTSINSLLFCTACGNLLTPSTSNSKNERISCEICHTSNSDTSSKTVVTVSKPSAFPSALRTKLRSDVQEITNSDSLQVDAEIQMTCEKCGGEEVRYYTQQLRSADEGQTVFYTCQKCGWKWNTNM